MRSRCRRIFDSCIDPLLDGPSACVPEAIKEKMGKIKGNCVNLSMKIDELANMLELTDIGDLVKSTNTMKKLEKLVCLSERVLQDVSSIRKKPYMLMSVECAETKTSKH